MSRGVIELYESGLSIPQVADSLEMPRSTVRSQLQVAGVLRTRAQGVRNAAEEGRLGSGFRGKKREFTDNHKRAISNSRKLWGEANARGVRTTSSGYVEYTRGEKKGRLQHAAVMEERLGRSLKDDECVHHIDGNRQNNSEDNLALLTRAGHNRLHRREEALQGIERRRNPNGTWR